MMTLLSVLLGFLEIGCFSFGGAYGAIPLICDVVLARGWLSEELLTYMIAVSESTPGPIMVNIATFVGSEIGGFWGAVLATVAVVTPAFLVIFLITRLFKKASKNPYVQAALRGLKPCIVGIVAATGLDMIFGNCFGSVAAIAVDWRAMVLTALLLAGLFGYRCFAKKKLSPFVMIGFSAIFGMVVF